MKVYREKKDWVVDRIKGKDIYRNRYASILEMIKTEFILFKFQLKNK